MLCRYAKSRLTDYLINLTGEPISIYQESSGDIVTFSPQKQSLPAPSTGKTELVFHYVISQEQLEKIKGKRDLADIAIVRSNFHGRDNRIISELLWANDPKKETRVLLYPGVANTKSSHI